jgi:hypothetical protein
MMRAFILTVSVIALCGASAPAFSQPDPQPGTDSAREERVLNEAKENAEIIFQQLPAIKDSRTRNAVLRYNLAARGWWVGSRCRFRQTELSKEVATGYESNLAIFTHIMDSIFENDFGGTPGQAHRQVETIQIQALNATSANKFFGCSQYAEDIWLVGAQMASYAAKAIPPVATGQTQPAH